MTREGCQQTPTARLNIHLIYQWGNIESLKNIMPAPSHDPTFESASPPAYCGVGGTSELSDWLTHRIGPGGRARRYVALLLLGCTRAFTIATLFPEI